MLIDILQILAMLLVATATFTLVFEKCFEDSIVIVIPSIVLTLYIFGCLGLLLAGYYFINTTIMLAFFGGCYLRRNHLNIFASHFFTAGLLLYIVACLIIYFWIQDYMIFTDHDEYSHWGLTIKNTFFLDQFAVGKDTNTFFPDYLPGTVLLQYWLLKINGNFSKIIANYGIILWGLAILVHPVKMLTWRKRKTLILYLGFMILFPLAFAYGVFGYYHFYVVTRVDFLLGFVFAYSLFSVFTLSQNITKLELFNIILSLAMLILIKKMGLICAITVALVASYDIYITGKKFSFIDFTKFSYINQKISTFKLGRFLKNDALIFFIISLAFIYCIFISWELFIKSHEGVKSGINYAHFSFIKKLFTFQNFSTDLVLPHAKQVIPIYFEAIYNLPLTNGAIKMSYLGLVALSAIAITAIYYDNIEPAFKQRIKKISILFAACFLVFSIGHLWLYIGVFSEGESLRLSAFGRYLNMYFIAIIFTSISLLIYAGFVFGHKKYRIWAYIAMLLPFIMFDIGYFSNETYHKKANGILPIHKKLEPIVSFIVSHTGYSSEPKKVEVCYYDTNNDTDLYGEALHSRYLSVSSSGTVNFERISKWNYSYFKNFCSYVFIINKDNKPVTKDIFNINANNGLVANGLYSVIESPDEGKPSLKFIDKMNDIEF